MASDYAQNANLWNILGLHYSHFRPFFRNAHYYYQWLSGCQNRQNGLIHRRIGEDGLTREGLGLEVNAMIILHERLHVTYRGRQALTCLSAGKPGGWGPIFC